MHNAILLSLLTACASDHAPLADADGVTDAVDAGAPARADAGSDAATTLSRDAELPGAVVRIHLRATAAPVPHDPATSGRTPRDWVSGIRNLHLLRSMSDPAPFVVFSHGDGFVEATYEDGSDTVVGSIARRDLPHDRFTVARVVHTHTQFTVDALVHASLGAIAGEFDNLVVLSDRTRLGGRDYSHGHYRYVFRVGPASFPLEGEGFEPPDLSGGGFTVRTEGGETAYYFPAAILVDPTGPGDIDFVFEVNIHEAFRWIDQDASGYRDDTFDVTATPPSYEPIVQMGANSFRFFME